MTSSKPRRLLLVVHLIVSSTIHPVLAQDVGSSIFQYIDPLIGTSDGGHVFPGATLPFGMAKAVADVDSDEAQGGYASDNSDITGFSQMHDSGTGGGFAKGNFPIFPQTGCPGDDITQCNFPKALRASQRINSTVQASPGYFAVSLNTSIHTEITVSNHTALYRLTFPGPAANSSSANTSTTGLPYSPLILVDLTDLSDSRTNGSVAVDPSSGRIIGNGSFSPSFGVGSYDLHFCADFTGAALRDTGVFQNNRPGREPKSLRTYSTGTTDPVPAGAWAQFHPPDTDDQIVVRVGLSYLSTNKACQNAEAEFESFDFDEARSAAEDAWGDKLSVVSVDETGVNSTFLTTFWSGLYRSLISPQDVTGENPLWQSSEPYYDSYYCIWDSYRSIHPLITLVDPFSQTLMVRSLIDIYRHEGWLPDCRMDLCKGYTQGGSNADVVLADTFVKGFTNSIDWDTAYEAVLKDAQAEPPIWSIEGRGGLASWKDLAYIPADDFDPYGVGPFTRSISRTVEYAYNDFTIAEMASGLNKTADAEKYIGTSANWVNLFKADQTSYLNVSQNTSPLVDSGFTGFLQPRYLNGTYGFQDPSLCSQLYNFTSCYLNEDGHETYEGSSWLYTFYAPHDMAKLITTLGGPQAFTDRLQYFHNTPGLNYIGDEQAFLMLYLFHYAGRPGLSSYYRHFYIPSQFNDSVNGIPGNDDSGAMGSFAALTMMGLWPMSGQNVYLINPPFFQEVNITNPLTGKTATVRNVNFDGSSYNNIYVQSAILNGEPYTKSWLTHSFFRDGGVLELTLGANESSWGTRDEDLPPSVSNGGFFF
ncbi:family 92 glycoside hydrolase [Cryphonectria parasitica EP155]|uniref:Family 92 glycoside hydrolase n=1 Tax=Cryphonectria parasitica (strain ATCC 38755 / EP155) TaxID=660469 RepID=A0A9P4XU66_CRYP1|nr:family 92 glycoside hydrolase [Cryphonectria parasitica EP155]KAF3760901.1 family 92 glycoside hydrolase [Cryphonectria parasitica EP155]